MVVEDIDNYIMDVIWFGYMFFQFVLLLWVVFAKNIWN